MVGSKYTNWINSKIYILNSIKSFPDNDNDDTDNFDDESNVTTADDNHDEYDLLECHEKRDGRSTRVFAVGFKIRNTSEPAQTKQLCINVDVPNKTRNHNKTTTTTSTNPKSSGSI